MYETICEIRVICGPCRFPADYADRAETVCIIALNSTGKYVLYGCLLKKIWGFPTSHLCFSFFHWWKSAGGRTEELLPKNHRYYFARGFVAQVLLRTRFTHRSFMRRSASYYKLGKRWPQGLLAPLKNHRFFSLRSSPIPSGRSNLPRPDDGVWFY